MPTPRRYVRRRRSDVWHFHKACRNYPKQRPSAKGPVIQYRGGKGQPDDGELCDQCMARQRVDDEAATGEVVEVATARAE